MSEEETVPAKQMNEVNRFIQNIKAREIDQAKREAEYEKRKAEQAAIQRLDKHNIRVRVHAPSISKRWIVGKVKKMTQDTLVIRGGLTLYGRRFYQVPLSSISNLEMSLKRYRNTGEGFKIGLGVGLGLYTIFGSLIARRFYIMTPKEATEFPKLLLVSGSSVCVCTLLGATTISDEWIAVSPQRLNLSIAPTSAKGLQAALTFNF